MIRKLLNNIILKEKNVLRIVDFITFNGQWKPLDEPKMSSELQCPHCDRSDYYTTCISDSDLRRIWICANSDCLTSTASSDQNHLYTQTPPSRAIVWPLFCEIMNIGDLHHSIRFEDVDQSPQKIAYAKKFAEKPNHILFFQGPAGTGKSYFAMAICELFTRRNTSCQFTTQQQMFQNWTDSFKSETRSSYIQNITNLNLLVIDDFGTAESTPAFMKFFFDLINSRMQWTDRGTIITTNLTDETFSKFCGLALSDRIETGQKFLFAGKNRRKKPVL